MILPAEKELRMLARFADARMEHDRSLTGHVGRALEDATYTLCVMTGAWTAVEALATADVLLQRYCADRKGATQENEVLVV